MHKIVLSIVLTFIAFFCFGQKDRSYTPDVDYTISKIKDNYPGYTEKVNPSFFTILKEAKKSLKQHPTEAQCFSELSKITLFFRDLHLRVNCTSPVSFDSSSCREQLTAIEDYFKNKNAHLDRYEGYWKSDRNNLIVALKKDNKDSYTAYIVESKENKNLPGSEKFTLNRMAGKKFQCTYINSRNRKVGIPAFFRGGDTLLTSVIGRWVKISNYHTGWLQEVAASDSTVSFQSIDAATLLIKVPESDLIAKATVDSLVNVHKALFDKTPNLIIDIRNNTGGTWWVYKSLLPYIYTNPIVTPDAVYRCSEDIISDQKKYYEEAKNGSDKQDSLEEKALLDSMELHRGGWYFQKGDTLKYNTISKFPKKIYLIFNYCCVSASELFITFCKQSKKVVLAGEPTWGASDYLEYVSFTTPDGQFQIDIPRVKAVFPLGLGRIDNKGIKPDLVIPYSEKDWVKFVADYSKAKNDF